MSLLLHSFFHLLYFLKVSSLLAVPLQTLERRLVVVCWEAVEIAAWTELVAGYDIVHWVDRGKIVGNAVPGIVDSADTTACTEIVTGVDIVE